MQYVLAKLRKAVNLINLAIEASKYLRRKIPKYQFNRLHINRIKKGSVTDHQK